MRRLRSSDSSRAKARWRYRSVTRQAFRELRDAVSSLQRSAEAITARREQTQAITRTYDVANEQYDSGYLDYLDLLDAERGLINAKLALVDAQLDQLVATATLCRALGGGM